MAINVQVSDSQWNRLNKLKKPGRTFQDVLEVIICHAEEAIKKGDLEIFGEKE